MTTGQESNITPRVIAGLLIAVFGIALLLGNMGLFDARQLIRFWPLGLIVIGLSKVFQDDNRSGRTGGWILVGLGVLFTTEISYFHRWDLWRWWPLAVIFVGVMIMAKAFDSSTPAPPPATAAPPPPFPPGHASPLVDFKPGSLEPKISEFAFWSGVERRVSSPAFKEADLTAIMGGIDFDLRQASADQGQAVIEVFVLWGGIEITVPPDWAVSNEVTAIMGGAEDSSTGTQQSRNRLVVKGFVLMGGVEIKT